MDAEAPAPRPLRDAGARTTTGWTTPTPQLKQRRRRVRTAFRTVGRCARYNVGRTQVLQEQKRRVRHVSAPRNTDGTMSPRALRFPGALFSCWSPLDDDRPNARPYSTRCPSERPPFSPPSTDFSSPGRTKGARMRGGRRASCPRVKLHLTCVSGVSPALSCHLSWQFSDPATGRHSENFQGSYMRFPEATPRCPRLPRENLPENRRQVTCWRF